MKSTLRCIPVCLLFVLILSCSAFQEPKLKNEYGVRLKGFTKSKYFDEQIKTYVFAPEVKIHINAPAAEKFDKRKPVNVVFFGLPNGNTTAWTIGKKLNKGDDWHFAIQNIGAQIRQVRETVQDENTVVVYLEAEKRSWPSWRSKHENSSKILVDMYADVMKNFEGFNTKMSLSSHSGGGSQIFGYINGVDKIPSNIKHISFLDSDYAYEDEKNHGDKLLEWVKTNPEATLCIICYDDRKVILDGKRIVSDSGGTWGRTEAIIKRFSKDIELKQVYEKDCFRYRGLDGRIDIIMHTNPDSKILHTVLVGDMNGLIHALTTGTKYENQAGKFGQPTAYDKWVQDGDAEIPKAK